MHIPVMKKEVLDLLKIRSGGLYIDCTFGQGGHTRGILQAGGVVIALDRDKFTSKYADEIKAEFPRSFYWVHSSFANLFDVWKDLAFPMRPDGILFDLGFSSNQIEDPSRGFSFLYDSSLDMRYDTTDDSRTALDLLNILPEDKLAKIFFEFGEEHLGNRMARKICEERKKKQINSCFDLISILKPFNSFSNKHFATKIFQALRIFVNDESSHIEKGVDSALNLIKFYGRIVIITFHSIEDRIIKNKFCNKNIMIPSKEEIDSNPRSRSAKVRWFVNTKQDN